MRQGHKAGFGICAAIALMGAAGAARAAPIPPIAPEDDSARREGQQDDAEDATHELLDDLSADDEVEPGEIPLEPDIGAPQPGGYSLGPLTGQQGPGWSPFLGRGPMMGDVPQGGLHGPGVAALQGPWMMLGIPGVPPMCCKPCAPSRVPQGVGPASEEPGATPEQGAAPRRKERSPLHHAGVEGLGLQQQGVPRRGFGAGIGHPGSAPGQPFGLGPLPGWSPSLGIGPRAYDNVTRGR